MYRIFLCLVLAVSLVACGNETKTEETATKETATTTAASSTESSNKVVEGTDLPSVPKELMMELWEKADYTDVIFYYMNFSLSQDNQTAVRNMVQSISPVAAPLNPNCKPIGRIFFQIQGENAAECDLYFSRDCAYVVFFEGKEQKYANYLSETGIKFFTQIFQQVEQQSQQQNG